MERLDEFLKRHRLFAQVSKAELEVLKPHWQNVNSAMGQPWYYEFFQNVGKTGVLEFFKNANESDFQLYSKALAVNGGTHLDIGSGSAITPLLIRHKRPSLKVFCVDVYDKDLSDDARLAFRTDPSFSFQCYAAGSALPFQSGQMDSASLFYVLHHCQDRNQALALLKEIHRILKTHGKLIVIEEPVLNEEDRIRRKDIDKAANMVFYEKGFKQEDGFDVSDFFYEYELSDLFQKANLQVIERTPILNWSWITQRVLYIIRKA